MHESIRDFHLRGNVGESNVVRDKQRLVSELEVTMRDNGFIPVLDLNPQFTREFNPKTDGFTFVLTIYGVKDKDAWNNAGISDGVVQKSTTLTRSKPFLSI